MNKMFIIILASLVQVKAQASCPGNSVSVSCLNSRIDALTARAAILTQRMLSLQQMIRTTPTAAAGDTIVIVDATLGAGTTKCGTTQVTGWTENIDDFYVSTATAVSTTLKSFDASTGVFKPQVTGGGWYKICVFFRFRNTGNSNDVTIKKDGSVVAAFGNAITADWSSTGTCTIQLVLNANSITVHHESGDSNDCIEVTGWTENIDDFYVSTATAVSTTLKSFDASTGVFKPQVTGGGWYKICVFFRFRNTGNSNDVTIKKDGSVVAAFGNAITADWSSTGTCTIQLVLNANSITVHHESGDSNDCIEETGWNYARFTAHLISCDTAACTN